MRISEVASVASMSTAIESHILLAGWSEDRDQQWCASNQSRRLDPLYRANTSVVRSRLSISTS